MCSSEIANWPAGTSGKGIYRQQSVVPGLEPLTLRLESRLGSCQIPVRCGRGSFGVNLGYFRDMPEQHSNPVRQIFRNYAGLYESRGVRWIDEVKYDYRWNMRADTLVGSFAVL